MQSGYLYAQKNNFDIAVQMDGDGQHMPEYLLDLIQPILEGKAACTIGSRFLGLESFRTSFMRRLGIRFLNFVIRCCTGKKFTDATSGFRAANRQGIDLFVRHYAKDFPEPESIVRVCRNGLSIQEVPVKMRERAAGNSSIRFFQSVYYMIKVTLAVCLARCESKTLMDKGE